MRASLHWHKLSPKGSAGELIILCNNFGALSSPSLSVKSPAFEEFSKGKKKIKNQGPPCSRRPRCQPRRRCLGSRGEARLPCRRPGRAPPGADRKSSSGWGRPVQIRYFVPLPNRGAGGEGGGQAPRGKLRGPGCRRPLPASPLTPPPPPPPPSEAATAAWRDSAPRAVPQAWPSHAHRLLPAYFPPLPAPVVRRARSSVPQGRRPTGASGGGGGGALTGGSGQPTGSGGALEPPAGRRCLPPSLPPSPPGAAGSRHPRGGGVGPRLRVAGSPSPPGPGAAEQRRFNLAFMCHRVREGVLRGGANVKHLDGGTGGARGGGGLGCAGLSSGKCVTIK